jgi:chromosome condensin MukBEF ATPase and DNA-binding subunit MukB
MAFEALQKADKTTFISSHMVSSIIRPVCIRKQNRGKMGTTKFF